MKPLKVIPSDAVPAGDCTTPSTFDRMNGDLRSLTGSELVRLRNELEVALTKAYDAKNFEAYERLRARRDEIQEIILEEQLEW